MEERQRERDEHETGMNRLMAVAEVYGSAIDNWVYGIESIAN